METHSFFAVDDTPTPTRFLRNCEEIGLFQDLHTNPFDETFRIAIESSSNDISNVLRESLSKSVTEETLNTPKIITVAKSDGFQNVYSIIDENEDDFIDISTDHYLIESVDPESACTDKDVSDESEEVEVIEEPIPQNGFATHIKPQPTTVNAIVTALTSTSPNTFTYTLNSNTIKNGIIGNYIIQSGTPISSNNNSLHSSLNNKQLVLPKTAIASAKDEREGTPEIVTSNVMKAVTTKQSDFLYQLSSTKSPTVLSGKNVIILPSRNCLTKPSTSQPIKPALQDEPDGQKFNADPEVKVKLRNLLKTNSCQLIDEPICREARKRQITNSSTSSVSDEKREYSRERNRMAQKRCRKKKKMWLMQMKKETETVLNENQNLQVEVGTLKAEIAHLKTLLLAHRHCSVTRAMFGVDVTDIQNGDYSGITENIEIPVPDSTDDSDNPRFTYKSIFSQVNQVSHHHSHIHVHVPSSSQSNENVLESVCAKSKSGQHEIKQFTQTRKLIFDSKVVPIKPDDRSASVLHKQIKPSMARSNVVTIRNAEEIRKHLNVVTVGSEGRSVSRVIVDSKPMQSTEISASTNGL